jgi:hypothetical protein
MSKKIKKKKLINKLVHMIELADLAEFEDASVGLDDYHRGTAHGLRAALSLIDDKAVPRYSIIDRGERIRFEPYDAESELTLEWADY